MKREEDEEMFLSEGFTPEPGYEYFCSCCGAGHHAEDSLEGYWCEIGTGGNVLCPSCVKEYR